MTDMGPTDTISLDLSEDLRKSSIIDYREATNNTSDILKHWGGIICADFERNNPEFQPLTNAIKSTKVVTALNHVGTAFISPRSDDIELNRNDQHLSTLVEIER